MAGGDKRHTGLLICAFLKACHSAFAHPNILKLGRITNLDTTFLFTILKWPILSTIFFCEYILFWQKFASFLASRPHPRKRLVCRAFVCSVTVILNFFYCVLYFKSLKSQQRKARKDRSSVTDSNGIISDDPRGDASLVNLINRFVFILFSFSFPGSYCSLANTLIPPRHSPPSPPSVYHSLMVISAWVEIILNFYYPFGFLSRLKYWKTKHV